MINPTHFDLQSLRLFLRVVQSGSLTQAAPQSNMTLSALSKRIAELERTVDCALFIRQPRGLQLTPAGKELARHAREIMDAVNNMASGMNDFAIGVRGHVRVWANTSSVIQFLPNALTSFLQEQPLVRISLEEGTSPEVVTAILDGKADIGIFSDHVSAHGLDTFPYKIDQLVALVPRHHPLASRQEAEFADTLDFDFVGLNQSSSLLQRILDAATALDRPLPLRIQVRSFDAICRMIEAGLGISILPEGAIPSGVLENKLQTVRIVDAWASRRHWIGIKSGTTPLPEVKKLLQHLRGLDGS